MKNIRLQFNQLSAALDVIERENLRAIKGGVDGSSNTPVTDWISQKLGITVISGYDEEGFWAIKTSMEGNWIRVNFSLQEVEIVGHGTYSKPSHFVYTENPFGPSWTSNETSGGGGGSNGGGSGAPSRNDYDTGFNPDYLNMFFGAGEVVFGVYAAVQTGGLASAASYYMIADGLGRMGLSLNSNGPSNIGGAIGSFFGPDGQKWGELTNDGVTAVLTGGAFTTAWQSWGAFAAGDYILGSYFLAETGGTTYNVADILYTHLIN